MNSIEITRYLFQKGYLSKEAALKVLKKRDSLIKQATVECANEYFFEKTADQGWFSSLIGKDKPKVSTKVGPKVQFGGSVKNLLPLLGLASLVALGTTATKVGLGLASDVKTKGQIDKSYKQMFKEFPDLQENKGQATKYFNMIARFAPVLATNPIIAGTWVKGTMNQNVVDPQNIQRLMEAQGEWEKIRSMKSPLLGFKQELPASKDIFSKAIVGEAMSLPGVGD